jgi:hypothetical protein
MFFRKPLIVAATLFLIAGALMAAEGPASANPFYPCASGNTESGGGINGRTFISVCGKDLYVSAVYGNFNTESDAYIHVGHIRIQDSHGGVWNGPKVFDRPWARNRMLYERPHMPRGARS